ncbi:MAG: hypothetical protein ACFCUN_01310 [Hyphomicrobiaceae bacterium]
MTQDLSRAAWARAASDLVLLRACVGAGTTRGDILRDLQPFFAHRLSPSEFRDIGDAAMDLLVESDLIVTTRGRVEQTESGSRYAVGLVGSRTLRRDWQGVRDEQITALALGLERAPETRKRMLSRPDGLRMAILQAAFDLEIRRVPTPARVRSQLASVALQRAFGNQLDPHLEPDSAVDARASRRLAGQLARRPRDFGTDSRLIAALAAEAIGAAQADPTSLRLTLIRGHVSRSVGLTAPRFPKLRDLAATPTPGPVTRPNLTEFAEAARTAASACAEGWSGSRKAFVSHTFDRLTTDRPEWRLTEIEFKSMLTEAHRAGRLALAAGDLKSREQLADYQRSAIVYQNTVFHFVRAEG